MQKKKYVILYRDDDTEQFAVSVHDGHVDAEGVLFLDDFKRRAIAVYAVGEDAVYKEATQELLLLVDEFRRLQQELDTVERGIRAAMQSAAQIHTRGGGG